MLLFKSPLIETPEGGPICNISYINSNIMRNTSLENLLFNRSFRKNPLFKDGFSNDYDAIKMYYDETNDRFYADENKSMLMVFIYKSRLTSMSDKFFEYLTEKVKDIYKNIISYENGIIISVPINESMTIEGKIRKIIELNLISFLGDKKSSIKSSDDTISCIYNDNERDICFDAYIII